MNKQTTYSKQELQEILSIVDIHRLIYEIKDDKLRIYTDDEVHEFDGVKGEKGNSFTLLNGTTIDFDPWFICNKGRFLIPTYDITSVVFHCENEFYSKIDGKFTTVEICNMINANTKIKFLHIDNKLLTTLHK